MSNSNTDDHVCPICLGDKYTTEKHDEDSTHREECPCQQKASAIDVITDKLEKKEGEWSSLPDIDPISIKLASVTPILEELEGMAQAIETLSADLKAYKMEKSGYADEQNAIAREKLDD